MQMDAKERKKDNRFLERFASELDMLETSKEEGREEGREEAEKKLVPIIQQKDEKLEEQAELIRKLQEKLKK